MNINIDNAGESVTYHRLGEVGNLLNRLWADFLISVLWVRHSLALASGFAILMTLFSSCRFEDQIIFQPISQIVYTPADVSLNYEDVYFETTDGIRLNGWFIPHPKAKATLLWFHGNAGNIGFRVDNIKQLHDLVEVNIFIFDYRGYGRSEGSVSEEGTYLDGVAAIQFLRQRLGRMNEKTVYFGRSLGAAIAAEMARRHPPRGLILESPFESIRAMAQAIIPSLPIGSLLQTQYDVLEKIKSVKTPLLILHGDRDEVIPFAQGKNVFAAAPEPKAFYVIAGAGHNDTFVAGGQPYYHRLRNFIESVIR